MNREVDRLTSTTFDVLVVGGGICGLTIAYDAAQRGLAVALIERSDFGSGTSFNHLRTIHGGLRYLRTLDIRRARESARERRTFARIAPHAVRPLAFVLPLSRSFARGMMAMRFGFALDRLVAFDRNRGVPPSHQLPSGYVVSRAEAIERFPLLRHHGLTGAAVWHDYVAAEADRLTFAFALAAEAHGASLANYVEARAPLVEGRRVVGVRAVDVRTGRDLEIAARLTLNATGAAVDHLVRPLGASTTLPMLKAMNLVTAREGGDVALGGRGAAGRNLFMVPWRGRALFGTWESARRCDPADTAVVEGDVASFIVELNEAFPTLDLTRADVTLVHLGVVPARSRIDGSVALEGHEQIRDHAAEGVEGLVSVVGTKYTTARLVAERIVDALLRKLQRAAFPCRTAATPLSGGSMDDDGLAVTDARRNGDVPGETISHLVAAYGSRYEHLLDLSAGRPEWRTRISDDSPVIGAELVWAVRHEMALTLADVVVRRTPLGALGYPGDAAVQRAAAIVGAELGWSEERACGEVSDLRHFYETLTFFP